MQARRALLPLPFRGAKRRVCEPQVRAPLSARGRAPRAGLLGEGRTPALSNAGVGSTCAFRLRARCSLRSTRTEYVSKRWFAQEVMRVDKKLFAELVESVTEAGKIARGECTPVREFRVVDTVAPITPTPATPKFATWIAAITTSLPASGTTRCPAPHRR